MISKKFHCLFILMLLLVVLFANHGCIGIIGGQNHEFGHSIILDEDNGDFIIVGKTASSNADNNDGFIASYSISPLPTNLPFFQLNWFRLIRIAGTGGNDQADCVLLDGTDYYVLCGFVTRPNSSRQDLLLAKFKKDGHLVFAKAYDVDGDGNGEGDRKNDRAKKMIVDDDGNYVVVGTTYSKDEDQGDILVAKFDPDGNFLYAGIIGDPEAYDVGMAIIQDGDDNYVLVGYTVKNQDSDIVIIKLKDEAVGGTAAGFSTVASVRLEWANGGNDIPTAIVYHRSINPTVPIIHSYVVAGHTTNPPPGSHPFFFVNKDLLIFKINIGLNNIIWGRYFATPTWIDGASSLIIADDENRNLVVGGFSWSSALFSDGLIAKFNQVNGSKIWARTTDNISTPGIFQHTSICDITKIPNPGSPEQFYVGTGYTSLSNFGNADIMTTLFHMNNFNCYSEYDPEVPVISAEFFHYPNLEGCLLFPYVVNVTPAEINGQIICPQ